MGNVEGSKTLQQLEVTARVSADPDLFELAPAEDRAPLRLLCSYSEAAGEYFWPRRRRCPITGTPVSDVVLVARGVLWSWTFVHLPWPGPIPVGGPEGYGAGLIELPEGPRVPSLILGQRADWHVGATMIGEAVDFEERDGTMICLLGFRPGETG